MRAGAPLGFIAWQLMLTESIRAMQRYGDQSQPLSNIDLLIPLMVGDQEVSDESGASSSGERYLRSRINKDMPFSDIPASEFVLDENLNGPFEKKKRGHKHSPKQEYLRTRPRSVYLESVASEESDERDERSERSEQGELGADVWRACQRLTRYQAGHQHELLLLLCSELLDAPPAPPAPPPPPGCPCCQQNPAPLWMGPTESSRRDLVGVGEDPFLVKNYMRSRARKRRYQIPVDLSTV